MEPGSSPRILTLVGTMPMFTARHISTITSPSAVDLFPHPSIYRDYGASHRKAEASRQANRCSCREFSQFLQRHIDSAKTEIPCLKSDLGIIRAAAQVAFAFSTGKWCQTLCGQQDAHGHA